MQKLKSLIFWIALAPLLTACVHQSLSSASDNTLKVASNTTLAGSLTEQAPKLIKRSNAVVIDLRHPAEGIDAESEQMRSLSVPYYNLPVSPNTFDQTTVDQLDELLDKYSGRQIIVHCQSGNRAGLLWAALLKERGMSSADASTAVSGIVTKPGIHQAIEQYEGVEKQ